MKFIHTADLQIGARYARFGDDAEVLRAARLATLKRVLDIAQDKGVDGVLIAGDMFESNQIANSIVDEAYAILASCPDTPVVILPGNHDPLDGPGCIWMRKPFATPPPHVTVCKTREAIELAGASILPVPITQKVSTRDPSFPLKEMAASEPKDKIRIGITHGALAIEGKHQPNDQPIALDAATRAGLDYLAIGHWHKPQAYDDNRLAMSGTPEPDAFGQESGFVSLVDIAAPGKKPTITQISSATYSWHAVTLDLMGKEPTDDLVASAMAAITSAPDQTVVRVELVGPVSAEHRETLASAIAQATEHYAVSLVDDKTSTVLSESLWNACMQEHPLLAQVVADVEKARLFGTGHVSEFAANGLEEMTLDEFQSLCTELKVEPDQLREGTLESMVALLTSEVAKAQQGGDSL